MQLVEIVLNRLSLLTHRTRLLLCCILKRHFSVSNKVIEASSKDRIGMNIVSLRCNSKDSVEQQRFLRVVFNFGEDNGVFVFCLLQLSVIPANSRLI